MRRSLVALATLVCAAVAIAVVVSRTSAPARAATPTATATPVGPYFAVDCDAATPGIQNQCTHAASDLVDIDVVFVNNAPDAIALAGFAFQLHNPERTRLVPLPGLDQNLNGNPDAPAAGIDTFGCADYPPTSDTGDDGPLASVSTLSCFDPAVLNPPYAASTFIASGGTFKLGTVHYSVPASVPGGGMTLSVDGFLEDAGDLIAASCGLFPYSNQVPCLTATIQFSGPTATPTLTRTLTPTATSTRTTTPAATATPPTTAFSFTLQNTVAVSHMLRIYTGPFLSFSVVSNAPHCASPSVSSVHDPESNLFVTTLSWPSECASVGDATVVQFTVASDPTSTQLFSQVSPFPQYTYLNKPAPTASLSLDCETTAPGVQSTCDVQPGATHLDVDVVYIPGTDQTWQYRPADLDSSYFDLIVSDSNLSRLLPSTYPSSPASHDSNPDLNQSAGFENMLCIAQASSVAPSHLGCFPIGGTHIPIPASGVVLGTIHYDVLQGGGSAAADLAFLDDTVVSSGIDSLHCGNYYFQTLTCNSAHLTLTQPSVRKQPEGNAANADLSVPKANLWLCHAPAACAGAGEGELRVVEHATNVFTGDQNGDSIADGLGAYEFSVEYDNFVIQSVNPCDIVFGPGGAGATRGPVDELNSSSPANADCSPDPGASNNGTCSMSFVLENVVRFGCVTNGQTPGPSGDFDLASLVLVPHSDLSNDIFPGNNNGVLTVLKDNGCELVDVFGHAVIGSINGGLTPVCGDLAVTVRILEGDLNLDCKVDVTDEQLISFRYGAFFGDLYYQKWFDLEPALHDLDIDIKDLQKVFGRDGSTCQAPVPAQPPLDPPTPFGD